ncbi:MAG TPA: G-D-S-L family lipolytic protein, partial [Cyclobacteriaceae bacterium]|nr:G-D-S-L family lipolytic protein [Cyclobacteriaceae bacterium]
MKLVSFVFIVAALLTTQDVKKKVIFFGDSITEAGAKPGGYILKVADLAAKESKSAQYDFIG